MKQKKVWPKRQCKECKKEFQPYNNSQSMCQNPCKSKPRLTIEQINENWLNRSEEARRKQYKQNKNNFMRGDMRVI